MCSLNRKVNLVQSRPSESGVLSLCPGVKKATADRHFLRLGYFPGISFKWVLFKTWRQKSVILVKQCLKKQLFLIRQTTAVCFPRWSIFLFGSIDSSDSRSARVITRRARRWRSTRQLTMTRWLNIKAILAQESVHELCLREGKLTWRRAPRLFHLSFLCFFLCSAHSGLFFLFVSGIINLSETAVWRTLLKVMTQTFDFSSAEP